MDEKIRIVVVEKDMRKYLRGRRYYSSRQIQEIYKITTRLI